MDRNTVLLYALFAVQLYSAADDVRSLLVVVEDTAGHLDTLSKNAIGLISTLLTAVRGARLRRIRRALDFVHRSLRRRAAVGPNDDDRSSAIAGGDGRGPAGLRPCPKAWLTGAAVLFALLKYGQLAEKSGKGANAFGTAADALLRTVSTAANYYVTVMFVDHVYLVQRALRELNARIAETLRQGSVAAGPSSLSGMTVPSARLAYLDVCHVCAIITRTFQTQLLINILGNVFAITFMTLTAFNAVMMDSADTIHITLYFLYDSVLRTLQMYCIIEACHVAVQQANSINLTFQKKINEHYQINFIKRKVQLFILEMIDHKVEFVIYGFISLDFEMFVSIMGTVATYLLILVQLGSSPEVLTSNATTTMPTTPVPKP